jgi:transposase
MGLDDWAWRQGHRAGTSGVARARGCPLDVLAERAAATVATWRQAHPDVTVVARDRAAASAAGMRQGAPEATPVADRCHLLKHVATALQEVFSAQQRAIDHRKQGPPNAPSPPDDGAVTVAMESPVATSRAQQQLAHHRARRVAESAPGQA